MRFPGAVRALLMAVLSPALGWLAAGCADRLPDQDRRILQAVPVAKLSTDILWKEYQADKRAADRKYWGKAVEITGKVSSVATDPPPRVMFTQPDSATGVQASLLDDRAPAALADAAVGQRMTLRCFCEGVAANVILKSCIKP